MKTKFFFGLLLTITLFGGLLRLKNLATIPFPGQSQDEYSNTWVGLSLIQIGMPVGMSGVSGNLHRERIYINPDRIFQQTAAGDPMTIAYPWFDHPPLVGMITGSFAYLRGGRLFEDATSGVIRKPAVAFGIATIFLTGIVASTLFGNAVGLLAALFYAVSPLVTVTNRMIQAENFFTPLALLALYCWFQFAQKKRKAFIYLSLLPVIAAVLCKLSAFAFVLAGMLLLYRLTGKKWPAVLVGTAALAAFSWWAIFGVTLSPTAFWSVLTGNSARIYGIGFQAVAELITTTKVTGTKTISDGWVLASFVSLFVLFFSKVKNKEWILVPSLCYLAVYLFFGGESYGWYRIPFYPFGFIALASLTVEIFRSAEIAGVFLFLIPLGVAAGKVTSPVGNWLTIWRVFPVVSVVLGDLFANKLVNRVLLALVFAAAIVVSLIYNLKIDISFWYQLY